MIGIIKSDDRMQYTAEKLKQYDEIVCIDSLEKKYPMLDVLVLPMNGIKNNQLIINNQFQRIPDSFWENCRSDCRFFSATASQDKITDLSLNHGFNKANARLSAEGVLFLLIDNTNYGLETCEIDLLGYGSCGEAIYDLLTKVGCKVRVVRRHKDLKHSSFISVDSWKKSTLSPIIINTSITNWIDEAMIEKMNEHTLIINIATHLSFDERAIQKKGARLIHAKALPSMIAPLSAGEILADAIIEELKNEK